MKNKGYGQQLRFTEYVSNELSEKIYFEILEDELSETYKYYGLRYDILLEGKDNLGNTDQYISGGADGESGKMALIHRRWKHL